jgi:hypothetical protein
MEPPSRLDFTKVGSVDARRLCESLLRKLALVTQEPDAGWVIPGDTRGDEFAVVSFGLIMLGDDGHWQRANFGGDFGSAEEELETENLHSAWNRSHDCVHEEPPEKGIAISGIASRTGEFQDRRSDRKRTFRHPL